MLQRKQALLWLSVAAAVTGCTTEEAQIRSSGTMGQQDAEYVDTAYKLVQLDNAAGKLAATKASDPRVQDVAATLITQANTLQPGLQAALKVEGATPPNDLSPDITSQVNQLQALNGPAFDRQFVADELALHKSAVAILQKEDSATKDAALRGQVETELPAVQDNLAKLQVLSGEYNQKQG